MWLAFAIGGVVALLSTYSYAKLGATFPSAGGAVHFLVKSFGDGVLAGGLNLFMWAGYIISLALYATAFGEADRKSTRLNSSHQIISYAVFCLKKKKIR